MEKIPSDEGDAGVGMSLRTALLADDRDPRRRRLFGSPTRHKIVILSEAPHDLSRDTALGGAQSKDLEGCSSYPCCSELFNRRSPHPEGSRHGLSPGAENKNRCILLCSVSYIYVAQIPFSGIGGRKGTSSRGKMTILEVLRLRAHKPCVTRKFCEALRSG